MAVRHTSSGAVDSRDNEHTAALTAVAFAAQWLPYGGADSYEIFTKFGLTPAQCARRLRRSLDCPTVVVQAGLTPELRDDLRIEARRMAAMTWPADAAQSIAAATPRTAATPAHPR